MSFLTEFIQKYNNQKVDFDRHYGHQCFDLANQYRFELTGLNPNSGLNLSYAYEAFDEPLGFLNSNTKFEHIDNQVDNYPIPGDIIIWLKSFNGWAGHIAIVSKANASNFEVLEQNAGSGDGQGDDDRTKLSKYADYAQVAGWLRILEPNPNAEESNVDTLKNKVFNSIKQLEKDYPNQYDNWGRANGNTNESSNGKEDFVWVREMIDQTNWRHETEVNKLKEQNSGLAKSLTDSNHEYVIALDGKAKAEELTRQLKTLNNTQNGQIANLTERKEELLTTVDKHSSELKTLNSVLDDQHKIVIKQGEVLNSKPAVWNWTEFIKGLIRRVITPNLAIIYAFLLAIVSSPEFLNLIKSTQGLALLVPLLPIVIEYFKPQNPKV